jgi:hypothetical protein
MKFTMTLPRAKNAHIVKPEGPDVNAGEHSIGREFSRRGRAMFAAACGPVQRHAVHADVALLRVRSGRSPKPPAPDLCRTTYWGDHGVCRQRSGAAYIAANGRISRDFEDAIIVVART